ncbi:deoxyribodipyrimidine photo-lyase [Actinorhabdospora filicis]|uniref:Deoxyribodipyrimidine photo-lyase n=1 Tax=Actinorhabdospora filicis TaxID=1785913 RepID=A0A9W6STC4_9ACTN|nr:deoxyribodipyrimidine photo-lyase [Actinorhabdospora filicis]GLZ81467.1 deoxyribodipyrimidine photo-lyase [Actinorhabdospora filicis]
MRTVMVVFTRDLRVRDNPALATACRVADRVVPLFVADPAIEAPPGRARFLLDALTDLRASLRDLGGDLLVRRGDPAEVIARTAREAGASQVAMAEDVSAYARRRQRRVGEVAELRLFPGVTVLPAGAVRPAGGDHYKVFTPYWRSWSASPWRKPEEVPARVVLPEGWRGDDPRAVLGEAPPAPVTGGESAGLARLEDWAPRAGDYAGLHDALAEDGTSRLSPYLRFGCVSPLELATDPRVPEAFVRQLCWRDFYHQLLAAFPRLGTENFRPGAREDWADDPEGLAAWKAGETGVALVDAGMRQLLAEGWMHNRARMVTASHLTKTLGVDWREGAAWFARHLLDADVANNCGNWQWTAGTGTDARPHRRFNPERQRERFDPERVYVDRWRA